MTRRNIELVLLCVAAPLVVLLFAMYAVYSGQGLSFNTLGVPIGIFAAFVVAHLAARKFTPGADPAVLPIAFALSGIGIAYVTRLAPDLASRQLIWLFVGIAAMILVMVFLKNPDRFARYKYTLMVAGIILLLSPMLPVVGTEVLGSRIWLTVGSFSFQPGEIAKVLIILFLAGYLAQNREMLSVFTWRVGPVNLPDIRTLMPVLLMWALAFLIVVFEKDLGSALVLFFVFIIMLYCATGQKFYLAISFGLAAIAAIILYSAFGHVQVRVGNWLDPFSDAMDTGYQLCQSLYSIAAGGLFGVGIGNGLADNIPVVESDFIFSAIAEESGLLGAAGVLLLFLCYTIRGCVTAARAKSDVSSFIAIGVTSTIVLQAFIIVGGVTRLIPLTGLTLPFISQGGSSLLASFIGVGLLMLCGEEGTGVESEMTSGTGLLHANSVLGRVSLGKRLTGTMIVFSVMFAILVANLTMIMVVDAEKYETMPGNTHTANRQEHTERGTISTYDGVVLARSVQNEDGTYSREYPAGDLASHVVGYSSSKYGTAGIEASQNNALQGTQNFATVNDMINYLAGVNQPGNDVKLTINSKIQQAAQDALAGRKGACIVMDPETGAVLAMASAPTYNAANVEDLISGKTTSSDGALVNRATQSLYAPGSTFKIVSLSTALENNIAKEDTTFDSPGTMDIGNAPVTNFNEYAYGTITLARATEVSSNTVYGQLGALMGAKALVDGAKKFGFNTDINFDLPTSKSLMPDASEMTEWETAWAAAGEPVGSHKSPAGPQATVLEIALCGCAIANDGTIMNPYLVQGIYNAAGEKSYTASPSVLSQAISASTAKRVRTVLEGVITNGTGTAAQISGVTVAGKTGTAETSSGDDMWFVGMAPAEDPKVVVAMVVEKGESGIATSLSQNVLKTALEVQGLM